MNKYITASLLSFVLALSCTDNSEYNPKTVDIKQTTVKKQSVGNCWAYAIAGLVESVYLKNYQKELDVSETYWNYWYFHDQILKGTDRVKTGGTWQVAMDIIDRYGFVEEGDFITQEAGSALSSVQAQSLEKINEMLQAGEFDKDGGRSDARIKELLNKAFGHDVEEARKKARFFKDIDVTLGQVKVTMKTYFGSWEEIPFVDHESAVSLADYETQLKRKGILKRVMKAMNSGQPVLMGLMVDFNAMGTDLKDNATFHISTQLRNDKVGDQGAHLVVLDDYVVSGVEGLSGTQADENIVASPEQLAKALEGDLVYFKAKNSWGTKRQSPGLESGFTRFTTEYLLGQLKWNDSSVYKTHPYKNALTSFILPPERIVEN